MRACLAVGDSTKDEEVSRRHIFVHGYCWTIASLLNFQSPSTIPILHHAKDEATSDIAAPIHGSGIQQINIVRGNSPCMVQTSPCQRRSRNHVAAHHPCQCCAHTRRTAYPLLYAEYHPSSEDDVFSQPAGTMTPSTVAAPAPSSVRGTDQLRSLEPSRC